MSDKPIWDDPNLFPDFGQKIPEKKVELDPDPKPDLEPEPEKDKLDPSKDFNFDVTSKGKEGFAENDDINQEPSFGSKFESNSGAENDDDDSGNSDVDSGDGENDYKDYVSSLREAGIFSNEEIEGPVDSKKLLELQQEEIKKRVDSEFEDYMSAIGEDGVRFLKYTRDGGEASDFFKSYSKMSSRPSSDDAKGMIRHYLASQGVDSMEIDDRIAFIESKEKLVETASRYEDLMIKTDQDAKDRLESDQRVMVEDRKKGIELFNKQVRSSFESEKFTSIVPEGDFGKLERMILEPIRKGDDKGMTVLNQKLMGLFKEEDKSKLLILAHLLDNDFNFSKIKNSIKSDVIDQEQKELRRIKITKINSSAKPNRRKSRFTDRL